ncbi:MAG: hypothetical protein LLF28_07915 [Nitrospiraceae bacterium]|nr:hypothetical protein [Nitrospiraceae bacterium]
MNITWCRIFFVISSRLAGGIFLLIAALSAMVSALGLIERARKGPGLFFAGVEIFGITAIVFSILGIAFIFLAKKLAKKNKLQ